MIPVGFDVQEFNIRADGRIFLDGEHLTHCFDFNEAEGWADVWAKDAEGHTKRVGDHIIHERRYGTVRLEMTTPECRAYVERMFPAEQTKAERTVRNLTAAYFRERRHTISPDDLATLTRNYLDDMAKVLL